MKGEIDHDRHLRIWGREGQNLIERSSLVIVGADNLGAECIKSASILGIGNISIIDRAKSIGYERFLDIRLKKGLKTRQLSDIIRKNLNTMCNAIGYVSDISRSLLDYIRENEGIDAIIDVSNNPYSQHSCYEYCLERKINFFSAAADPVQGIVSHYSPLNSYDKSRFMVCIPGFEADNQGVIISNILAGILIEEFRKSLFLTNQEIFKNVKVCRRNGSLRDGKGRQLTYYSEHLAHECQMHKDIVYSIDGFETREIVKMPRSDEGGLEKKRALILGCGAIGNYAADMLARLGLEKIDCADMDRFDKTNLNRQPLAYDGVGQLKAEWISKKINSISGRKISSPIIGFVGDSFSNKISSIAKASTALLDKNWFAQNRDNYDVIFGCFDNADARTDTRKYATNLKLNYIDGGSGGSRPNKGRALIYLPGRTNCMGCGPSISLDEKLMRNMKQKIEQEDSTRLKRVRGNPEEYKGVAMVGEGRSCEGEWVEGSINMSNQIAAGLMVGEARKISSDSYGKPVDTLSYDSRNGGRIHIPKQEFRCRCG